MANAYTSKNYSIVFEPSVNKAAKDLSGAFKEFVGDPTNCSDEEISNIHADMMAGVFTELWDQLRT